ncbi:MAG: amino acid adenylation domain-containing protein [Clostridia bacterium]|nr:amino acid adenylation domain-containing protein [Clostridia bacterium]
MNKEICEKRFPLSLSQLNILNLERSFPGTSINNISTTIRITGRLDFPVLQKSISLVLENDASLRTRLVEEDGTVLQYHARYVKETFPVYDFSNTSREGIENWENAVTRELIPLFEGALYRFVLFRDAENSGGVLVKLHHIIADGWTQIMLCNKIGRTYMELLDGQACDLAHAPDYELHVKEEQDYLASKACSKDERYWKDIVSQIEEPSALKSVNSAAISPVGRRKSFDLPEILNHAIYTYCQKHRVAPFAVIYMALAIYFKRNGGADRFTIGVPIINRTNYQFKQSSGMFVTTLPFYNEINDEWTLNEFNDVLAERWYEMLRHQRFPFSKICNYIPNSGRLFHIALSYQDSKIFESHDVSVELSGRWHYCGYQAEQLAIHLTNLKSHRQYAIDYDYLTQFFTQEEIVVLHHNLCHILAEALSEPDRPIYRLNVLSLEEKEEILYKFNQTDRYLEERSVYDALISNNTRHLNRVALIHNGERMTYGSLLRRGSQYAAALSGAEAGQEKLAAILLPRKFDLYAALIGSLEAGFGYLLLSESLPTERIKTILSQSHADILITDEKGKLRLSDCDIPMILSNSVDKLDLRAKERPSDSADAPGDRLAYVVYTSGSTGEPKGVEITQRNLLNLAQEMESVYGQGAVLSVCNVGFDAFMLESIVALLNGKTIVLPTDNDLEDPERLASLMNGYAVGFFSITPSRLSALLQSEEFRKVMWRMESIVCGGEQFPPELLKKLKAYTNAKIYNQYGPSETTVAVSMKELSHTDKITVGSPMGNCKLYVLDRWMNPLPIGGSGRLFVGGTCVGRGYRNLPELTEKVFCDNPFVSDDRLYDTGDLAYWTPNGEVVLTGRADRQVKLHGLRIELQEISACLESYPDVSMAYAKICEINGHAILGAYYTSALPLNEADLLSHAATYLPQYMIPAFIMRVSGFATTANGKVDESALPIPEQSYDLDNGITTPTAEIIVSIFQKVLAGDTIGAHSDYFLCGGNSLNALECIIQIEEQLHKKIRIADLYACRTAARLAQMIDGETPKALSPVLDRPSECALQKAPKLQEYPLTPIQQGIYVQSVLDPTGLAYNMPGLFILEEAPDTDQLTKAFTKVIQDDPIFRTAFVQTTNGVGARVSDEVDFSLQIISADCLETACTAFVQPFDLTKAPLLRAALWQSPEGQYYLLMDSHHIIGDGISTPVVLQRLSRAYRGEMLQSKWNFYDYVHTAQSQREHTSKELDYWQSQLQNLPDPLTLPTDFPRSQKFDYKGGEWEFLLPAADSEALTKFCQEQGYSEFALCLAAYGLLLSAISGNYDLIIGTPVAGRNYTQSNEICGPFINTLPLRLTLSPKSTVTEWLKHVQNQIVGLLDHQKIGLEDIISALNLPRGEMNALYRVMLTQSPVDEGKFTLGDHGVSFRAIPTGTVKMDLVVELAQKASCYALRFSYASSLFEAETIAFYSRCMAKALKELIRGGNRPLDSLSLLSPCDQEQYVDIPNFSTTPFINRPVHQILKSRAAVSPQDTAIIYHGERFTFEHLEMRAAAIAQFLEDKGVRPGQCVGLCLKRTPDLIAAMYGVLKAGCAYMFMLESFPAARMQYMLEISDAAMLLYDEVPSVVSNNLAPCQASALPTGKLDGYRDRPVAPDGLTNILFTSGSTGNPKGVMLRHRSVSNLFAQMKTLLDPIEGTVLCSTNSVFDCFIVETIIALAMGRTVVLADEEEMMLPWKLAELVETHRTGIFEMTPTRLQMCLGNEAFCEAAKYINIVLLGGEVLTPTLRDKFYQYSSGKLMNMYGPTEACVFTTMEHVKPGANVTIGSALQNTRTYVLDEHLRPVLPTAQGELYIAGECLSAGYVGRADLTDASFVDDIYFPEQKMYRSGDLVRLRTDGRFDYIGRKDAQVKLNGQRVELGEITCAIEKTGLVKQAATVAIGAGGSSMELHAFYIPCREDVDSNEISAAIANHLPTYMIPSRWTKLAEMPLTATNKVDMQALKRMASDRSVPASSASVTADSNQSASVAPSLPELPSAPCAPIRPDANYVLSVWNKVLNLPVTDTDVSFFTQGGTSMAALNVLSYYFNDGFELSLSDFYKNPTVNGQAQLLCAQKDHPETQPICHTAPSEPKESVPVEVAPAEVTPAKVAPQAATPAESKSSVLITGATGYFGIHLLKQLLDSGTPEVICLLRDGNASRLEQYLEWYFGKATADELLPRIQVIKGNITEPRLGLSEEDYASLAESVDEIYHCAADVRHYSADHKAYLKTNVTGTENMLALAVCAHASFYHMSTCSVSGDVMKDGSTDRLFTENDYDIGQVWEDNIYVKSKFLAEGLVFAAIQNGLRAKIFRLGRLVGRASDGKFQINPEANAFYLTMKGLIQLGAISKTDAAAPIEVTPVDVSAKEVLLLKDGDRVVYHIMNSEPPCLGDLIQAIVPDFPIVESAQFNATFREKLLSLDKELLAIVMHNWRMISSQASLIAVTNQITSAELASKGFVAPSVKPEILLKHFFK